MFERWKRYKIQKYSKELIELCRKNYTNLKDLLIHMKSNKTDCAIKIFNSDIKINYPNYIMSSIGVIDE